jgi:putative transposase
VVSPGQKSRLATPSKPRLPSRTEGRDPGQGSRRTHHLDVTIIRLLDGTRAYLHAVIDNYSRRILSWRLEERLGSGGTCRILCEAVFQLSDYPGHAVIVVDSGSENVNEAVDDLLDDEELTRVLAQVEVTFSNSMIEAFWRSLKHGWLYLHTLDSLAALRRLISFYVKAHDGRKPSFRVMPHSAFEGQTLDEVFFGTGHEVTKQLAEARKTARNKRMKQIARWDAAYALGRRVPGRCYCNGHAPECRETQQGDIS